MGFVKVVNPSGLTFLYRCDKCGDESADMTNHADQTLNAQPPSECPKCHAKSADTAILEVKIVHQLMAGAIGTISYGVDESGKVYVLDEKGNPLKQASETIATQVREQIKRGKDATPKG